MAIPIQQLDPIPASPPERKHRPTGGLLPQHILRKCRQPDQYHLALEDIETAMAVVHAEDEAIDPPKTMATSKTRVGRGVLPKHLPRIEEIIAPDVTCGCGAERHIIHCPAVDCKAINERG